MRRTLALAAAALLTLGACTGPSESPSDSASREAPASGASSGAPSAAPSGGTSPEPVDVAAPPDHGCYRLTLDEAAQPTSSEEPVSCRGGHTTQTIYVGTLDTTVDGHSLAVDSDQVQQQMAAACPRKLARYIGGSRTDRDLSRFGVVWFSPTLEQGDAGADWFRCDLIAFAAPEKLFSLPLPRQVGGALDKPSGLDTFGLCGTAAPGAAGFERVICAKRHSWRAFSLVRIPGTRYPGTAAVRAAGEDTCKARAQAQAADSLKFQYGWEWPTKEQWDRGQHHGFCWAPA